MSSAGTPENAPPLEQMPVTEPTNLTRKSYRRKYRKIMVNFEEKMRESTALFKDEQRIFDISQRLAEQTDQIMQMLTDLNSCAQVPQRVRYDLRPPTILPKASESRPTYSEEEGHLALRKGRHQLRTGELSAGEYQEIEAQVLASPAFVPSKSYVSLAASVRVPTQLRDEPSDSTTSPLLGLLTAKQEERYLQGIDAFLDGKSTSARPHAANVLGSRNAERTAEREREMQLKNPVSVYNWLRKHQPQVFLQDNEAKEERASKMAGSRTSRRTTAGKEVKQEQDMYDDEGIAMELGSAARGKRKRDDDTGYRPKGGNSRPTKRKKEDGGTVGRRPKKMSIDARS